MLIESVLLHFLTVFVYELFFFSYSCLHLFFFLPISGISLFSISLSCSLVIAMEARPLKEIKTYSKPISITKQHDYKPLKHVEIFD